MECYLDNSATTKPCAEAVRAATEAMTDVFGNPSSLHRHGFAALQLLERARATVAKSLRAEPSEIYFTPSGTVANNTAVFGAAQYNRRRGNKIVTTAMEHPSVQRCMERLAQEGFEICALQPNADGEISIEQFEQAIDENTILVSLMAVNNEVGSILPFDRVKAVIQRKNAPALLHVDAVQAYLKLSVIPKKCGIDLLSVSAHKVHGLKGAGALYIRKGLPLRPYVVGGGQEEDICSGTQAMPAIAAFAAAVSAFGNIEKNAERVQTLRNRFTEQVQKIQGVHLNSSERALPYIVNLSLDGIPSQVSVNFLSMQGVSVSAGSACSKGHRSTVLEAMGLTPERIDTAIRISLSHNTTEQETAYAAQMILKAAQELRKKG